MSEITHQWVYEEEAGTEEMPAGPVWWLTTTLGRWFLRRPYPVSAYEDEPFRRSIEAQQEAEVRRTSSGDAPK